ncbi:MAG: hydroxymethylbilane synthase [Lachnospiraceae bacterium]
MENRIRIGSRESRLAVIQAEIVKRQIQENYPEMKVDIITMKTTGDRILDRNLDEIGGKGLFVKELDKALLENQIDLSVHSLKDMPMETSEELPILAYSKREDPRDVLIYKSGRETIPTGGVIGSSSKRRTLQLGKLYPQCSYQSIRGNVQTRLAKLEQDSYDAIVLAYAGIQRLGLQGRIGRIFHTTEMVPAAGQGILAVQGRRGEGAAYLSAIMDLESQWAALAERSFVRTLEGGCSSPIGAYAQIAGTQICLRGLYYDEKTKTYEVDEIVGQVNQGEALGEQLALQLKNRF